MKILKKIFVSDHVCEDITKVDSRSFLRYATGFGVLIYHCRLYEDWRKMVSSAMLYSVMIVAGRAMSDEKGKLKLK